MIKPKGGRGNKAPYKTKLMRVPEPLASQVESLCQQYQDFLAGGGNPIDPPCFLGEEIEEDMALALYDPVEEVIAENCPIEELHLSLRAYNILKRARVNSVADLLPYNPEKLAEIKNFGQRSIEEVGKALERWEARTKRDSKQLSKVQ